MNPRTIIDDWREVHDERHASESSLARWRRRMRSRARRLLQGEQEQDDVVLAHQERGGVQELLRRKLRFHVVLHLLLKGPMGLGPYRIPSNTSNTMSTRPKGTAI